MIGRMTGPEARDKLQEGIGRRTASAQAVVERVLNEVPDDALVRGNALRFTPAGTTLRMVAGEGGSWGLHRHALGQVAERAKVPTAYASTLHDGADWQRELLGHVLDETYKREQASRFLVRSIKGEARGFLSDRFRRLDSRPVLETVVDGVRAYGAVPYEGRGTDVRVWLRAILPEPVEILPGEWVGLGLTWGNSDFGAGALEGSGFILRLICLNGAMAEDVFRQVHLGRRLDDATFSRRTYELDSKTVVSATRDLVRAVLSPEGRAKLVSGVRAAAAKEVGKDLPALLTSTLSKEEVRKVREAFDGPDVVNLPAERTMWRASNALSWVAQTIADPQRKTEIEKLAGVALRVAA